MREISLHTDSYEELLYLWLNELLYLFDTEHIVFAAFEVHIADTSMQARAWGDTLSAHHHAALEVKAVTHHAMKLEATADGWLAELILDV